MINYFFGSLTPREEYMIIFEFMTKMQQIRKKQMQDIENENDQSDDDMTIMVNKKYRVEQRGELFVKQKQLTVNQIIQNLEKVKDQQFQTFYKYIKNYTIFIYGKQISDYSMIIELNLNKTLNVELLFTFKTKFEIFIDQIISTGKYMLYSLFQIIKGLIMMQGYNFAKNYLFKRIFSMQTGKALIAMYFPYLAFLI